MGWDVYPEEWGTASGGHVVFYCGLCEAADVVLYIPFMRGADVIAVYNTQAFIKGHGHSISAAAVLVLF